MFGLLWSLSDRIRVILLRTMPTNLAITTIMTRRGLKWGPLAMFLAVPYTLAGVLCFRLVEDGWNGGLNILGLMFIYNAVKFLVVGPASIVRLIRIRAAERRELAFDIPRGGSGAGGRLEYVVATRDRNGT